MVLTTPLSKIRKMDQGTLTGKSHIRIGRAETVPGEPDGEQADLQVMVMMIAWKLPLDGQPTTFKLYLGEGNDPSLNNFTGATSAGMTDASGDPILYKSGEFNNENTDTQKYYRTRDASGNIISSTPMWEYKDGAGWHWIGNPADEPFHYTSVQTIITNDLPQDFDDKTMTYR